MISAEARELATVPSVMAAMWACTALRYDPAFGEGVFQPQENPDGTVTILYTGDGPDRVTVTVTVDTVEDHVTGDDILDRMLHHTEDLTSDQAFHISSEPQPGADPGTFRVVRYDYAIHTA